jgi:hypothetical protein
MAVNDFVVTINDFVVTMNDFVMAVNDFAVIKLSNAYSNFDRDRTIPTQLSQLTLSIPTRTGKVHYL